MLRLTTAVFLAAALMSLAACGSDNSTPTSPTTPAVQLTETFEGDLPPSSARVHPFASQSAGSVTATLTEITPSDTIVGLDLGTWTGVSCQINVARPSTAQGQAVAGTATTVATLCVRIYDVSDTGLPASVHYRIDVAHF